MAQRKIIARVNAEIRYDDSKTRPAEWGSKEEFVRSTLRELDADVQLMAPRKAASARRKPSPAPADPLPRTRRKFDGRGPHRGFCLRVVLLYMGLILYPRREVEMATHVQQQRRVKPDGRDQAQRAELQTAIGILRKAVDRARAEDWNWDEIGWALDLPAWQVRVIAGETVKARKESGKYN